MNINTKNRFNLIDEPWIPIVGENTSEGLVGRISLKQLFSNKNYRALGGNPIQKIALTKFLLAIMQSAYTPIDNTDWASLGTDGMAKKCLDYLETRYDCFWLYGKKPFLQIPSLITLVEKRKARKLKTAKNNSERFEIEAEALPKSIGPGYYPDLPAENNTILTQHQVSHLLTDAEKAIFIISLMNFAFGGKRVEKDLGVFTPEYEGEKTNSAKPAPSLGNYIGYLHTYLTGTFLLETIWLNILTKEDIEENKFWTEGLGTPPWDNMPKGEGCTAARGLKDSYMGCLVAMSRFVLLHKDGIYYAEGIQYGSHKQGWREPSMAIGERGKDTKLLWVDPNKRPWRELTSLLSFMGDSDQKGYDCQQIRFGLLRAKKIKIIGVWSGGLSVSTNSGDQSVKQDNDFVESIVMLESSHLGDNWYTRLKNEMSELDNLSKAIYKATINYFKNQKLDGKKQAGLASNLYWQLCERKFQDLVDACGDGFKQAKEIRQIFAGFANKAYDAFCPKETVRQLDTWANCRPNLNKYLTNKEGK